MQRLAIYDMDKTITRRPTWTPFLVHAAARLAPWRLILLPVAGLLALGFVLKLVGRARLKELTHGLLIGHRVGAAQLAEVADSFSARLVAGGCYHDALARIAADRAAGWRVVLATASCRFYVSAIARRLAIADIVATENIRSGQDIIARLAGENCYGAAKLRMIEAWLDAEGMERDDLVVRFYSDHASDAPALAWADEAFAVCPHGPLRRLAAERRWTILDWRR